MNLFSRTINGIPSVIRIALCIVATLTTSLIDYATGDYGITLLYLFPVYVTAKLLGGPACRLVTLFCVVLLFGIAYAGHPFSMSLADPYCANTFLQACELAVTGTLMSLISPR